MLLLSAASPPRSKSKESRPMSLVRFIFLSAALVNWLVAALFFAMPGPMYETMVTGPAPANAAGVMYLFATAVAVFGLGYFWVSLDLQKNRPIARLAVAGKLGVFVVALLATLIGAVSPGGLAGTLIDLTFGLAFAYALKVTPPEAHPSA